MEENKNKAVEKVEKVVDEVKKGNDAKMDNNLGENNNANNTSPSINHTQNEQPQNDSHLNKTPSSYVPIYIPSDDSAEHERFIQKEGSGNYLPKEERLQNDNGRKNMAEEQRDLSVQNNSNSYDNLTPAESRKRKKEAIKRAKAIRKERIKQQRESARIEREKRLAERRIMLEEKWAHQKAERQKQKLASKRLRQKRKADLLERQEQARIERANQREVALSQAKTEKVKLQAQQRAKKIERKREKMLAKENIKKEKLIAKAKREQQREQAKAELKRQREEYKQRNKEGRRGYGGWLAAVISLGAVTLVLSGVLTYTLIAPTQSDNLLEANYRKNFYEAVEQVDNIDLNLSKVLATQDKEALQTYLVDLAINSELAENDIQSLPLQDENKFYTTKLINQIGDYAKYLNKKLIDGQDLSQEDVSNLKTLYKSNLALKEALGRMVDDMDVNGTFSFMKNTKKDNLLVDNFNQLQNLSVQYPELIYDGPFSDGQDNREIKGLFGKEINQNEAREIFNSIFAKMNIKNAENVGSVENGIPCFNVQGKADGQMIYAQISKIGGKLIMFDCSGSCMEENFGSDYAIEQAEKFLKELGIENMKAVWHNLANNVYTINFASTQNGIIIYSDLIKVRVCAETAKVIGIEASAYYTNHIERDIPTATLSKAEAVQKVSPSIEVRTARLALCPIGRTSEKLCYEFSGEKDGEQYYVYIDAITGKQVQMFKVIESTEGTLLM